MVNCTRLRKGLRVIWTKMDKASQQHLQLRFATQGRSGAARMPVVKGPRRKAADGTRQGCLETQVNSVTLLSI